MNSNRLFIWLIKSHLVSSCFALTLFRFDNPKLCLCTSCTCTCIYTMYEVFFVFLAIVICFETNWQVVNNHYLLLVTRATTDLIFQKASYYCQLPFCTELCDVWLCIDQFTNFVQYMYMYVMIVSINSFSMYGNYNSCFLLLLSLTSILCLLKCVSLLLRFVLPQIL